MTQQDKSQWEMKPKPLIVEGGKPKWEKPFCWKCMRHTPNKKGYRTIKTDSGTRTREYTECKTCGSKGMHIPAHFDYYYSFGIHPRMFPFSIGCFLLLPLLFICPIIFILLTDDDKGQQGQLYGVLIFISVFFIAVYGGIFLWAESKYRAWKKWAKLRGWKELSKSERIKRGAKKR